MSRDEEVEQWIAGSDEDELRALEWDRQIAEDARNGKLARLAERALRDHEVGFSRELPDVRLTKRDTP